ncbi:type 1 glutamine amidotransferase [Brevibacillus sp. NRS-1366]|uniref:type 1 glutamine amidotransferase n=1 Tax=Brevibacillus sp. NRS-1366 TaxID=3233899 RepID=UPI003D230652
MRVHILQHMDWGGPGVVSEWMREKGHTWTMTNVHKNEEFPEIDEFDLLVILGGVMGVYEEEENPWLIGEKQWIRNVIDNKKRVLGICLGAQLIASSMGANVKKHVHSEIGWWPVQFAKIAQEHPFLHGIQDNYTFFEFHYDTFDIPESGVQLGKSVACKNQAFAIGDRVVGLQFHPEFNEEIVQGIETKLGPKIEPGPFVKPVPEMMSSPERFAASKAFLYTLLNNVEIHFNLEQAACFPFGTD